MLLSVNQKILLFSYIYNPYCNHFIFSNSPITKESKIDLVYILIAFGTNCIRFCIRTVLCRMVCITRFSSFPKVENELLYTTSSTIGLKGSIKSEDKLK